MFSLKTILFTEFLTCLLICGNWGYDKWMDIPCWEEFHPDNCDFERLDQIRVEDFDRCGPARIPLLGRNYFLGYSGRGQTFKENKDAFRRINILPKMLRDVSVSSMETTVLGTSVEFPIGVSPVAAQGLANPEGELATVAGLFDMKTIMILSDFANTLLEKVAKETAGSKLTLWMQAYVFQNRSITVDVMKRAERAGFKAIVVTVDTNTDATISCNARNHITGLHFPNIGHQPTIKFAESFTFSELKWLKSVTSLPIIAKGILTADDAIRAINAGVSAIFVSNHGGRQLDGSPATIDALPAVVDAVKKVAPRIEVYMDGGVRSGTDVYKAIARGAKMVFVGRPIVWGLAVNGSTGVHEVMSILRDEFNEAMLLSGNTRPSEIRRNSLIPEVPCLPCRNN